MKRKILIAFSLVLVLVIIVLVLADRNVSQPSLRGRLVYSGLLLRKSLSREKTLKERRREIDRTGKLAGRFVKVDVEPVLAGGVSAEWVCPPGSLEERAIFYLHGGAYTIGSLESHRGLAGRIARASGICALTLDYRLAPEHPYPAAVEDATAAYRWLLETGVPSENIVIAGDSAGGGLTVATTLSLRDAGDPTPAAAVLLSPWTDLAGTGDSITRLAAVDPMLSWERLQPSVDDYAGANNPQLPLVSPLYADLHGLPPLLIHVGSYEILLDDSTRLEANAREAGVEVTLREWPGMWHVWHSWAGLVPEGQQAIDEIGAFICERVC
jgi:monoterpene epsilon-lactone hydrolase